MKHQIPMFNPNPSQFNEDDKSHQPLPRKEPSVPLPPRPDPTLNLVMRPQPPNFVAPSCVVEQKVGQLQPKILPATSESMIPQLASPVPQIPAGQVNFNAPPAAPQAQAAPAPAQNSKDELEEEKMLAAGLDPAAGVASGAPPGTLITCQGCGHQFSEMTNTIYLACMHSYCLDCIKNKIFRYCWWY